MQNYRAEPEVTENVLRISFSSLTSAPVSLDLALPLAHQVVRAVWPSSKILCESQSPPSFIVKVLSPHPDLFPVAEIDNAVFNDDTRIRCRFLAKDEIESLSADGLTRSSQESHRPSGASGLAPALPTHPFPKTYPFLDSCLEREHQSVSSRGLAPSMRFEPRLNASLPTDLPLSEKLPPPRPAPGSHPVSDKPRPEEKNSVILLCNLELNLWSVEEFHNVLSVYGPLVAIIYPSNKNYLFAQFVRAEDAVTCVKDINSFENNGSKWRANYSKYRNLTDKKNPLNTNSSEFNQNLFVDGRLLRRRDDPCAKSTLSREVEVYAVGLGRDSPPQGDDSRLWEAVTLEVCRFGDLVESPSRLKSAQGHPGRRYALQFVSQAIKVVGFLHRMKIGHHRLIAGFRNA